MIINFKQYPDSVYNNLPDEDKMRIEEIKHALRKPGITFFDRELLGNAVEEIFNTKMPPDETKTLSKKEKRKLRRQKQKSEADVAVLDAEIAEETNPINQTFTGADGKEVRLGDIIDEKDTYQKTKERKEGRKRITVTRWLIRRDAVRKIADAAGIIQTEKKLIISPSIDNYQTWGFDVTVKDWAGITTTMLGEASNENTTGVARLYKGLTAERRGFVRAVFTHLRLQNLYGEDEYVDAGEEEGVSDAAVDAIDVTEYEDIAKQINSITQAKTPDELAAVGETIKNSPTELSENQVKYLRDFYQKKLATFTPKAF